MAEGVAMRGWKAGIGVLCACAALAAAAQTAPDAEEQRRLAEQKLRLVEMLVNSPAAQASAASRDSETANLVASGRNLLKEARVALAAQRFADAAKMLDEALRSVAKANSRNAGGLSDSVQKQRLKDMSEQVATYRASLVELTREGASAAAAKTILQRMDALAEEANKLAAAGHLGDANKKMAEAYRLGVEELTKLRAGQEVVMSLKFNSPAEEYAYEQKRFQSNEILVNLMIGEGRAEGGQRKLVDGFLQEAQRLRDEAADFARVNNHKEAVFVMERAYLQLNRALQSMGVPAF
jgi:hypothetical protein